MGPEKSQAQAFYRWVDADGRLHVVSSLDDVPLGARKGVERVELNAAEQAVEHAAQPRSAGQPFGSGQLPALDWLSFGAGFGLALALTLLFRWLPAGLRWLPRLAIVAGVAALLAGAYLGALRRSTGAGTATLATPGTLIEDAKSAVEKMNLRQKEQEQELQRIQAEGR
jgi:hypothetical protein